MKFDEIPTILTSPAGSARYGYGGETSDSDVFMLTEKDHRSVSDLETDTDYFIISLDLLRSCWGHPLLLGNITGDCTGDERLCNFLRQYRREITYSAPERTGIFGLGYVAWGEAFGFDSPIKAGLRTAMILSHMAASCSARRKRPSCSGPGPARSPQRSGWSSTAGPFLRKTSAG